MKNCFIQQSSFKEKHELLQKIRQFLAQPRPNIKSQRLNRR